jgi:GNAT superfamily N-acetyltransferase
MSAEFALADFIEANAWSDCLAAAPPSLGCEVSRIPGTDGVVLRTSGVPAPLLNRVIGLSPAIALSNTTLDWIKQEFHRGGIADFWISVWDGLETNPLKSELDRAGWQADCHTILCKFLFDLQAVAPTPAQASVLSVRLASVSEHATAGDIICRSFGLPDTMAPWMAAMVARPNWQMYFACDQQGTPVAAGAVFINGPHAWLGMGATLPEFRQQGAQQLLLAARLAAARAAGCVVAGIETEASIDGEVRHSLNNIRRAGFRLIAQRLNYLPPVA